MVVAESKVNQVAGHVTTNGADAKHSDLADGTVNGAVANWTAQGLPPPSGTDIEHAIVETVTYADLFDYPLTAGEIHRYLYHFRVEPDEIINALANGRVVPERLSQCKGYYTLPGRDAIVYTRQQRQQAARRLWPEAVHYGRLIAQLPFVRMVAVTGSLAMDNVQKRADIDYLIVTANDYLWICRGFVITLVRLAAYRHIELCPNYFISERSLRFPEQNLYTAHELVQMVPLYGLPVYRRLRYLNRWTERFLPNAAGPPSAATHEIRSARLAGKAGELLMRSPAGRLLEQWEMKRKIHKFRRNHPNGQESDFSPDRCKGHFDNHQQRTLSQYYGRFAQKSG